MMKRNNVIPVLVGLYAVMFVLCGPSYAFWGDWGKEKGISDYIKAGKEMMDSGRYDKGIVQLEKASEMDPHNAEALTYLGYCYIQTANYRSAEIELKQALNLNPGSPELARRYVYTLHKLNRLDEAYGVINELLVKSPENEALKEILSDIKERNIDKFEF